MGAGAVGCYFGALLARAGHAVTLIGRAAHVEAIEQHGLRLITSQGQSCIPLHASTEASAVTGADVVLLCVKSTDTEAAAAQIKPHLAAHALVVSLQNGVDNAHRLRQVLGADAAVAACAVYVAAGMTGVGEVTHFGRGELLLAPAAGAERAAQQFSAAGIATEVSEQVLAQLWQKLTINCCYNALSALTQMPYGWLAAQPGVDQVLQNLREECEAVAAGDGIAMPAGLQEAVQAIARTMPGQLSSTARDMARGRPTEIEHLNGYVVRRAQALGVAAPTNQLLQVLVQLETTKSIAA